MSEDAASKTKRKQEMLALQALGVRLVTLNADQLALIELPEPLATAVAEAKRVRSREGHRRQLQYIGRLMWEVDAKL
jgi:ribosome-associated protein